MGTNIYVPGNYLSQLNADVLYMRKGKLCEKYHASKTFDFVTFVLCLIYQEAIGLYRLITTLFLVG